MTPDRYARSIIWCTIGMTAVLTAYSCTYDPVAPVAPAKSKTHIRAERYIQPETAEAIIQHSKRPRTMLAIAAVETGKAGPLIRGDGGRSHGVFQIQPHHWGEVPDDLEGQVRKADEVFDILIQAYGYREAVKRWNGQGRDAEAYRRRVFTVLAKL